MPSRQRLLSPSERSRLDAFVVATGDASPRDQRDLMERPFFSLAKAKRTTPILYEAGDLRVEVFAVPEHGMATIWDADILIWAASQIVDRKHRVLIMLDEFPALGRLDFFESALAFMAGYGLKSFLIAQSLNQIEKAYGPNNAILDNCHVRVSFATNDERTAKRVFERLLPRVRYVGEVGLDGGPEYRRHWPDQQPVFSRVLELCAQAGGRIITIHSRRAATQVLDAVEARPGAGIAILHWFSGTQKELSRAVGLGCWFSVGPAMLFGAKGRTLVMKMPRDHVLTESDGPFAQVDGRAAWPWDADRAVETLAQIWSEPVDAVRSQLLDNLRRLTKSSL